MARIPECLLAGKRAKTVFRGCERYQADFWMRPDLMQFVQTTIFCTRPSCSARTFCKLGLKRRLLTLWA